MILCFLAAALAEDPTSLVDVPPMVEPVVPAAAGAAAGTVVADPSPPAPRPADPRALWLDGFQDTPMALHIGGAGVQSGKVEHRFQVVGPNGPMSVTELLRTLNDPIVAKKRKQEVTVAVILGSVGIATAASMLAAHSLEEVNNDPVAEPVTAVAGTLGFVLGVVAFGQPLQSDTQPWRYWTSETLRPRVDAYNMALPAGLPAVPLAAVAPKTAPEVEATGGEGAPVEAPAPDVEVAPVEAPPIAPGGEPAPFLPDKPIDIPDGQIGHGE